MASISPPRHSSPDSPVHTQLQHPLNHRRPPVDPRPHSPHDALAYGAGRQPLPRNFPAPPSHSRSPADNAALDAATAAITRAAGSLDVGDTGLLDELCETLRNPDLYTRPITRQRIIELLEVGWKYRRDYNH
jgi:hypothetical protein